MLVGRQVPSAHAVSSGGQMGSSVLRSGLGVVSSAVTSQLLTSALNSQIWRSMSKARPVEHVKSYILKKPAGKSNQCLIRGLPFSEVVQLDLTPEIEVFHTLSY